jgi:hypothetical protein
MKTLLTTTFCAILATAAAFAADDLLIADFEKATYAPWKVTGEAFGSAPAKGTLPGQTDMKPKGPPPLISNAERSLTASAHYLHLPIKNGAPKRLFNIRGIMVEYDAVKQELSVAGHRAPAPLRDGKQRLTIYCDRTGAEVFASDGLFHVPMPFQPKATDLTLGVNVWSAKNRQRLDGIDSGLALLATGKPVAMPNHRTGSTRSKLPPPSRRAVLISTVAPCPQRNW